MKLFGGCGSSSRLLALCSLGGILAAVPALAGIIGATAATPASVTAGTATIVTVTSVISDPSVIPGSVILQSLNGSGRVTGILGTLHDDGLNGDVAAGDGIYTLQTTVLQNSPGTLTIRVSAGFPGSLLRVVSNPVTVSVTSGRAASGIGSSGDLRVSVPVGNRAFSVAHVPITLASNVIQGPLYAASLPQPFGTLEIK